MSKDSESKAYDEGTVAYGDDVPRVDNPYEGKDGQEAEARQWFAGFDEAESNDPLGDPEEDADDNEDDDQDED